MSIRTRFIAYSDSDNQYEGMLAWDDSFSGPHSGVLVAHTIRGRSAFEEGKARDLAGLGYVAFALDVYGADWQLRGYGGTAHAFTNPAANDTGRGTVYDAVADRRSWIAMRNFLSELFE